MLSGLIWVQTVCKNYNQTTKVIAGKERAKELIPWFSFSHLYDISDYDRYDLKENLRKVVGKALQTREKMFTLSKHQCFQRESGNPQLERDFPSTS